MERDIQVYIDSEEKRTQLYKRTLWVVVLSQIFGGAGLAAGITVGALLAQDMLGTDSYAGLPVALFTLGSAGAALLVGRLSQKAGRRIGLGTGFITGGIGALGVVGAAVWESVPLLLISLLIYGAGTATNLQARYAGTDLANDQQRATAVSIAMVSTTLGAVAGPNLVGVMGRFAESIGVPALGGPFILAAAAYIAAGIVLLIMLKPDPLLIARAFSDSVKEESAPVDQFDVSGLKRRGVITGAVVMVLTQIVMVAVMTMTPVHMGNHGHELSAVGLVIGLHIAAMYLPSLITGVLVDKLGRTFMAAASGITLLAAGVVGAVAPGESLTGMIIALMLLGLGWNFGLISGTATIVDATHPSVRAKTQGTVDVFIALSGAAGGALSGMVVGASSFSILSLGGGLLSLILIPMIFWARGTKSMRSQTQL
ncbi:MFS transporter [Jeotgalibacillus haloalkalitolerans]|uniref:MFS transporter n=1 Tax=Jeotgalibacillus haloalkalitolerans TaxID=3104292 RepID=A0ABU5KPE8_9BACL|nr:MFS transporter [Jeotgalibacillus sp. HH7-29]MDZ5712575.1 MFS transporter [Jeotgalibacillus sp. HH7-29]